MNCRKCGCLILETDEHCPMCDAKQRGDSKPKANNTENSEILKGSGKVRIGAVVDAILTILAIVVIGLVLFRYSQRSDDAQYYERSEDQYFFQNE